MAAHGPGRVSTGVVELDADPSSVPVCDVRQLPEARHARVVVATSVGGLDDARQWLDVGIKMIGVSDVDLLGGACVEALRALKPTGP